MIFFDAWGVMKNNCRSGPGSSIPGQLFAACDIAIVQDL
jgi:hypothetical protein